MKLLSSNSFEAIAAADKVGGRARASRTTIGMLAFWSLIAVIAVARVYYFQPLDRIDRSPPPQMHLQEGRNR